MNVARALQAAALAALLAAVPVAEATAILSGQAVARAVQADTASFDGTFGLLHVRGSDDSAAGLVLSVTGASIRATQYDDEGQEVLVPTTGDPVALNTVRLMRSFQDAPATTYDATTATATLTSVQPDVVVHAFAGAGSPFTLASADDAQTEVVERPFLDPTVGIIETPDEGTSDLTTGASNGYWTYPGVDVSHVRTTVASATGLLLSGDFTLELMGGDLRLEGQEGGWDLSSGTWQSAVDPNQPGATTGTLYTVRQSFLRLEVLDGTLQIEAPGADAIAWSGPEVALTAATVQLVEATGALVARDGSQQRLTGATYRLEGNNLLDLNPSQEGVQLAATGLDANGHPLLPETSQVRMPGQVLLLGTVALGIGLAVLLVLAIARRRPVTLADVEARLEAGHYRAAARAAGRILARRPGSEDALISRAIALTKAGRPRTVVAEVQRHLQGKDPSDGVLHYVLGLALVDLQRMPEARVALQEAVRRTPSLRPQVAPHLAASDTSGQQGSSAAPGMVAIPDPHGYA